MSVDHGNGAGGSVEWPHAQAFLRWMGYRPAQAAGMNDNLLIEILHRLKRIENGAPETATATTPICGSTGYAESPELEDVADKARAWDAVQATHARYETPGTITVTEKMIEEGETELLRFIYDDRAARRPSVKNIYLAMERARHE